MCDFSVYGGSSEEWRMIEETLPPAPANDDILTLQKATNDGREMVARHEMQDFRRLVVTEDFVIAARDGYEIRARSYKPIALAGSQSLPLYLHLHGGGFVFGTLDSEDAICSRIALASLVIVLNVCYRHSPQHKWPTAWNDAEDSFEWLHANISRLGGSPTQVIVGGISAGAWLTASLVLGQQLKRVAAHLPKIVGQILMIPCLVHERCYQPQLERLTDPAQSSYKENEFAPILPLSRSRTFLELLDVKDPDERDLKLNPGNASATQVKSLPPTVFGIAGLDILRDEGLLYAQRLTEAGVPTDINLFRGVPHGFRRFGDKLTASRRWDDTIAHGISWALSKPSATRQFEIKMH
ncbi:Alpha/beta hydrolase fold-containing protein 6 [Elsinoe fawcettii]|nr:Alpha/beta hydrolase fold-containing protein 6 [Elsinoe fawcettii]